MEPSLGKPHARLGCIADLCSTAFLENGGGIVAALGQPLLNLVNWLARAERARTVEVPGRARDSV